MRLPYIGAQRTETPPRPRIDNRRTDNLYTDNPAPMTPAPITAAASAPHTQP